MNFERKPLAPFSAASLAQARGSNCPVGFVPAKVPLKDIWFRSRLSRLSIVDADSVPDLRHIASVPVGMDVIAVSAPDDLLGMSFERIMYCDRCGQMTYRNKGGLRCSRCGVMSTNAA